ncbi:hypothetical protein [Nisaea sp.]|uniref:hypothetical protein n=1 Tax=Nisaea sp. TaxID=2024842 RepID=UPI0032981E5C
MSDAKTKQPMTWIRQRPGLLVLEGAEDLIQISYISDDDFMGPFELRRGRKKRRHVSLREAKDDGEYHFKDLREIGIV